MGKLVQENNLYKSLAQSIRNKRKYSKLLDDARNNIPSEWWNNEFTGLRSAIDCDMHYVQIYKCLKGTPQLLAKVILSVSVIDEFLSKNGFDEDVSEKATIRPTIYTLNGFDAEFLKRNIAIDKKLFIEMKHATGQIDRARFWGIRSGTRFFRDLSNNQPCSIVTACAVSVFLQEKGITERHLGLVQHPIDHMLRPARKEK
ncbi:MAG: hypothetical protein MI976_28105 [Pseudomonadales bacterium]|nr:hypothetical protein [Pseudomonadales bacterium]